tara:strand:+ start:598 stop:849 length:252 start_codon:yes stop_codon:yes gene_type:complete
MNPNQREAVAQYERYMNKHSRTLANLTVSIMSIVEECGGDSYEQGGYGYKVFIEKQPVMNDLFEDYRDDDDDEDWLLDLEETG